MAKGKRCGGAGSSLRTLPTELQEEILIRIPVQSLIRFESVCKTWQFKFQSSSFIELYGTRRAHEYSELYTSPDLPDLVKMFPRLKIPLPSHGGWRRAIRSFGPLSNGIYCLTSHAVNNSTGHVSVSSGEISLCNLSIRDYKAIDPFPPEICSQLSSDNIGWNTPSHLHVGFGKIDGSPVDYKVVVLVNYGKSFIGLVYSLQSGEWKKIVDYERGERMVGHSKATKAFDIQGRRIMEIYYSLETCPRRFLEGCWHWIAIGEDKSINVLSFNFADEAFRLMGGPPRHMDYVTNESWGRKLSLLVLHDHLVVINLHTILSTSQYVEINAWMMMEYGVEQSWTRIYKINPNFYGNVDGLLGIKYHPSRDRDEESGSIRIESLSFQDDNNQIVSYDNVGDQAPGHWDSTITQFSAHIQSLVRLSKFVN